MYAYCLSSHSQSFSHCIITQRCVPNISEQSIVWVDQQRSPCVNAKFQFFMCDIHYDYDVHNPISSLTGGIRDPPDSSCQALHFNFKSHCTQKRAFPNFLIKMCIIVILSGCAALQEAPTSKQPSIFFQSIHLIFRNWSRICIQLYNLPWSAVL